MTWCCEFLRVSFKLRRRRWASKLHVRLVDSAKEVLPIGKRRRNSYHMALSG